MSRTQIDLRSGTYSWGLNDSHFLSVSFGSWVIGANMGRKLFVALQLEDAHHFVEGSAGERTRRLESPPAFGAPKTTEMRIFNPYELPAHDPCRCATTLSDHKLSAACRLGRIVLLSQGGAPDCGRELSAVRWRKMYRGTESTLANLDGLSGILHTRKILVYAQADLTASLEAGDSLNCWFQVWCVLKRSELLSIRACIQRSVIRSTKGSPCPQRILPRRRRMACEFFACAKGF